MHPCLRDFGVVTCALQFREAVYNFAVGQGTWQVQARACVMLLLG